MEVEYGQSRSRVSLVTEQRGLHCSSKDATFLKRGNLRQIMFTISSVGISTSHEPLPFFENEQ
jgi:hypothetical protein